ncbi:DUF3866 family protein [Phytomonospora sp. NPDC050363]|uniref:DUF3866 family protein n=1 Tax=Phytomonospora sp. NPDC050363 TaxID=3155642 RepID=UPI0033D5B642
MVRWRTGTVTRHRNTWKGAVELDIELDPRAPDDPPHVKALAYTDLVGTPRPGDRVILNTNALKAGLGTGGYAHVIAIPDNLPADSDSPGHIVKARYSPLQTMLLAADEEASPHRETLATADDIDGMPVVTADLHSALPAILAGIHQTRPGTRVAYVMSDGGALPAAFSRTLDALAPHLTGTVTIGQAFGGDLESTNIHTGLLAARHALRAEITITTQGPGNLGTGTTWGFSGTSTGEAINATHTLGGRPIGALRVSDADKRSRHVGISHHSITAYGRVALAQADLVLPEGLDPELKALIDTQLPALTRHRVITVGTTGLDQALRDLPVKLSTMGRGLDADHAYFLTNAATGRHAAHLL